MKIGVFDSGLGGLIILDAIRNRLPQYDYIYFGDTKNLPYGDKSEEEIFEHTKRAVIDLFDRDVALVIVACNTASARSLRNLQDTLLVGKYAERKILGVIIPTIETLVEGGYSKALLIGTRRTVESKKYDTELMKRNENHISLTSIATPELVPYIESGDLISAYLYLEKLLIPLVGEVEVLILGCTHYTVLKEGLRKRFQSMNIISQDEFIPDKLESYLRAHPEIESKLMQAKRCEHIFTGKKSERISSVRE